MALSIDFYMIEAKLKHLIGNRGHDSDQLHEQPRENGIDMISSHRKSRTKRKTQDGRRLSRHERCWLVERFFASIQCKRRLLAR